MLSDFKYTWHSATYLISCLANLLINNNSIYLQYNYSSCHLHVFFAIHSTNSHNIVRTSRTTILAVPVPCINIHTCLLGLPAHLHLLFLFHRDQDQRLATSLLLTSSLLLSNKLASISWVESAVELSTLLLNFNSSFACFIYCAAVVSNIPRSVNNNMQKHKNTHKIGYIISYLHLFAMTLMLFWEIKHKYAWVIPKLFSHDTLDATQFINPSGSIKYNHWHWNIMDRSGYVHSFRQIPWLKK